MIWVMFSILIVAGICFWRLEKTNNGVYAFGLIMCALALIAASETIQGRHREKFTEKCEERGGTSIFSDYKSVCVPKDQIIEIE